MVFRAQRRRAEKIGGLQSYRRGESQQLARRRVRLPHQTAGIQKQNAAGKVREYGRAQRVGGLCFSTLRELLSGELMFLLLQLLNDGVIGVYGQSLRRQRSVIQRFRFRYEILPQAPNREQAQPESCDGSE